MTRITVVGSINIDLTNYFDDWPSVGQTVTALETRISLGGKGANQCVAAARLGGDAVMVGAVGHDGFGDDVLGRLEMPGLQCKVDRVANAATGMAFIDVVRTGENIIRLSAGANGVLDIDMINAHRDEIVGSKVVLLQNEVPVAASLAAARLARDAGAIVIMDPAPAPVPMWDRDILSAFDIITPNAHEAKLILGSEPTTLAEARDAAKAICDTGVGTAIVTMGGDGVAWSSNGIIGDMAAPKVDTIDTVAAGDCFNGALGVALSEGRSIEDAIQFAVCAAALATTRKGASVSVPERGEVDAFLADFG